MPYVKVSENGKSCVYKQGEDKKPTGKTLGCHDTDKEADDQIAALYAQEKKDDKELVAEVHLDTKGLPAESTADQSVSKEETKQEAKKETSLGQTIQALSMCWSKAYPWKDVPMPVEDEDTEFPPMIIEAYANHVIVAKGMKFFKVSYSGKYPEYSFAEDEKWTEVEPGWNKKKELYGFKVIDGDKWIGWWTNAFEDREKEIFATKAIGEFIEFQDKKAEHLPLEFWHIPYSMGEVLWLGMAERIAMAAGTLNDTGKMFAKYYSEHPEKALGMSHGYKWDDKRKDPDGVYHWFRTAELSFLPLEVAANAYTAWEGVSEMQKEKKDALAEIVGAEKAEEIVKVAEAKSKELEATVRYKEQESAPVVDADGIPGTVDKPAEVVAPVEKKPTEAEILAGLVAEKLAPVFMESFKPLAEALAANVAMLKELTATKEVTVKPKSEVYRASVSVPVPGARERDKEVKSVLEVGLVESIQMINEGRGERK
jgi:hypothetical protein